MKKMTLFSRRRTEFFMWGLLCIVLAILFFSHTYNDIVITTRQGINFWKILFRGDLINFYSSKYYCVSGNAFYTVEQGCVYNIIVYLCFALWNIPLAILEGVFHVDVMNNLLCLAWSKLMLVAALIWSAAIMVRILEHTGCQSERKRLAVYLLFSSAIVLSGIFINSQYDILGIPFQLLGILALLQGKEKRSILFFSVAICFKFFAILIFVPLLLVRKKRILPLLGSVLLVFLPAVVSSMVFRLGEVGQAESSFLLNMVKKLFSQDMKGVNLFIPIYGALMIWCYQKKECTPHEILWICFAAMTAFFTFCETYPYWKVLIAPYWVMLLVTAPAEKLEINLLLEGIGLPMLVVSQMVRYYWCFWGDTMKSMLMRVLFPQRVLEHVGIIQKLFEQQPEVVFTIARSAFITAAVAIAYLNFPKHEKQLCQSQREIHLDILVLRFFIVTLVSLLPIISLFY